MPLYIRDDAVDTLAAKVQAATGVRRNRAVRLALEDELTPSPPRRASTSATLMFDRAELASTWSPGKPVGVAPLPGSERVYDPTARSWVTPSSRNAPYYLPNGGGWLVGVRRGLSGTRQRGGDRSRQVSGRPGEFQSHPCRADFSDAPVPDQPDEPGPPRPDFDARRSLPALVGRDQPDSPLRSRRPGPANPRRRRLTSPS